MFSSISTTLSGSTDLTSNTAIYTSVATEDLDERNEQQNKSQDD